MPIQLKVGVQKYVEYYIEKKIIIGVSIATATNIMLIFFSDHAILYRNIIKGVDR